MSTYTAADWAVDRETLLGHDLRKIVKYTPGVQEFENDRQLNDYDRAVWFVLQQLIEVGILEPMRAEDIYIDHYIDDPETESIKDRERLCWWLVQKGHLTYDEADYMVSGCTLLEARHYIEADIDCSCELCGI